MLDGEPASIPANEPIGCEPASAPIGGGRVAPRGPAGAGQPRSRPVAVGPPPGSGPTYGAAAAGRAARRLAAEDGPATVGPRSGSGAERLESVRMRSRRAAPSTSTVPMSRRLPRSAYRDRRGRSPAGGHGVTSRPSSAARPRSRAPPPAARPSACLATSPESSETSVSPGVEADPEQTPRAELLMTAASSPGTPSLSPRTNGVSPSRPAARSSWAERSDRRPSGRRAPRSACWCR